MIEQIFEEKNTYNDCWIVYFAAQSILEPHLIDLDVYFAARTADIGAAVGKLRSMILL